MTVCGPECARSLHLCRQAAQQRERERERLQDIVVGQDHVDRISHTTARTTRVRIGRKHRNSEESVRMFRYDRTTRNAHLNPIVNPRSPFVCCPSLTRTHTLTHALAHSLALDGDVEYRIAHRAAVADGRRWTRRVRASLDAAAGRELARRRASGRLLDVEQHRGGRGRGLPRGSAFVASLVVDRVLAAGAAARVWHRATGRRRELPRRVAAAVPRARQLVLDVLERRADEHVDAARTLGIELLGHVDDGVALRVPRSRESR